MGFVVRKAWCGPISSEWKKVVRVGWSSVRPSIIKDRGLVGAGVEWMIWLTLNTEVTAEIRLSEVDIFDLDLHVVDLSVRLLCSFEFAPGAQEGGCGVG